MDIIKRFFGAASGGSSGAGDAPERHSQHDVFVAACALFLEMGHIDDVFSADESDYIMDLMKREYNLSDEYAAEIAELAGKERSGSIDLWHFTNLINQNYSSQEKLQVVELIWRIVYYDGRLDAHENYLMGKLRKMLHVSHRDMIDAKLRVLDERNKS